MSVIGFDFGCETSKIAVAQRGGIQVLQNSEGRRSTPSEVAFSDNSRIYGNEAVAQKSSNFKKTFYGMKQLLGKKYDNSIIENEKKFLSYELVPTNNGNVGVSVRDHVVTMEQLTGAYLTYLKGEAEKSMNGQRVTDCVLSCPTDYTDRERRALLDAAKLAGLNVLRLMNETTAVALNYGILRQLPADQKLKVLFYDMGYATTKATLVAFEQGKLQVLSSYTDRQLGSRDFDRLLMEHFAAEIKEKYKMDVLSNAKATLKLRKECIRAKKILSANQETPFNVEYIMNDTDVHSHITRQQFEELAKKSLLDKALEPIRKVLNDTNIKLSEINSVEVVGGGIRVPMVQEAVKELVGQSLSFTCDGDESVARGCVLQCAMLSPNFRVREFSVTDINPYPITVSWGPESSSYKPEDEAEMFKRNHSIPIVKQISFKDRKVPMRFSARYSNVKNMPIGTEAELCSFVVSNFPDTPPNACAPPKMKVKIKVDLNNLVVLSSAALLQEVELPPEPVKKKKVEKKKDDEKKVKDEKTESMNVDEQTTENNDNNEKDNNNKNESQDTTPMEGVEPIPSVEEQSTKEEDKKPKEPPKPKKSTQRSALQVQSWFKNGFSNDEYNKMHELETQWLAQDRLVRETQERMNELETYVLEMRSSLDGELRTFMLDNDRETFLSQLNKMEDWLYEDGFDAQKSEYIKRLKELRGIGDPVVFRMKESLHRDEEMSNFKKKIVHYQLWCGSSDEKYKHIAEEEKKKVMDRCTEEDTWLAQKQIAQEKLHKYENPVVTCDELRKRSRALEELCNPIVNTPKPKPKKEEKKKDDKKEESSEKKAKTEEKSKTDENVKDENAKKEEPAPMDVDEN